MSYSKLGEEYQKNIISYRRNTFDLEVGGIGNSNELRVSIIRISFEYRKCFSIEKYKSKSINA